MATWISSDGHLWHKNIIKYCNRPFHHVEEMNEALIFNWNECVSPDDEVIYLGDLSLAGPELVMPYRNRMNGIWKIFMQGNHDRKSLIDSPGLADTIIKYSPTKSHEIIIDGIPVVLSHCPLPFNPNDKRKDNPIYLWGHTHQYVSQDPKYKRQIHIGVDSWNYRPASWDEIKSLAS